jgi:hypothetical protein
MNACTTPDRNWCAASPRWASLFALALVFALAQAVLAGTARTAIACSPGPTTIGGQPAEVFCGPARATVHVAGQTLHFRGGTCTKAFSRVIVDVGTEILTRSTVQTQPYFGASLPVPPSPKASKPPTVAWDSGNSHGASPLIALEGPLVAYTLSKSLTSGKFSGVTYPGRQHFRGTFSC